MSRIDLTEIPDSFRSFAAALLEQPDPGPRLLELLGNLGKKAPPAEAAAFALMLRRCLPTDSRTQRVTDAFIRKSYPAWYIQAINDRHRNSAYRRAIEAVVTPKSIVLEAGTGSGLFSMLAARAGARHVYACEMDSFVAGIARENITRNGLSDRVTVLGRYEDVELGRDMPERADVFIHEFVSAEFVTPGMKEMIAGLRDRLLTPDAAILPQNIGVRGMLVGGARFREAVCVSRSVEGLDLSAINRLSLPLAQIPGPVEIAQPLSEAVTVVSHDLASGDPPGPQETTHEIPVTATGTADGILQWIRHGFADGSAYENRPELRCHWATLFRPFSAPVAVRPGQSLHITVKTTETEVFVDLSDRAD